MWVVEIFIPYEDMNATDLKGTINDRENGRYNKPLTVALSLGCMYPVPAVFILLIIPPSEVSVKSSPEQNYIQNLYQK